MRPVLGSVLLTRKMWIVAPARSPISSSSERGGSEAREAIEVLGIPKNVARRIFAASNGQPGDAVELGPEDGAEVVSATDRALLLRTLEKAQSVPLASGKD